MELSEEVKRELEAYAFIRPNARLFHLVAVMHELNETDWLTLLGYIWTSCNNLADALDVIYFESPFAEREGPIREMMLDHEWEAFCELPDRLTIYRGCYENLNDEGLSFSLVPEIAREFPYYEGYDRTKSHQPILITAEVLKSQVSALKDPGNEQEIIVKTWTEVQTEHLPRKRPFDWRSPSHNHQPPH